MGKGAGKNGDKPDNAGDGASKGKGGIIKIALGAVLLLGLGAGGAYGAFAMGLLGNVGGPAEPDQPKLVLKGEDDPYTLPGAEKEKDAAAPVYGEGGSKYRTAYYSFADSFTSNLADSPGLVQVELAVSTRPTGGCCNGSGTTSWRSVRQSSPSLPRPPRPRSMTLPARKSSRSA